MVRLTELTAKFRSVWPFLNERTRRLMAASEAKAVGWGGVTLVHRASGLSRKAILKGIRELDAGSPLAQGRIRRPGAGRKPITETAPALFEALEALIEPDTRGDPESPLRWTCKSTRMIAQALRKRHHPVSHVKVSQLLHDLDYSLQSNRKTEEGRDHPDRELRGLCPARDVVGIVACDAHHLAALKAWRFAKAVRAACDLELVLATASRRVIEVDEVIA